MQRKENILLNETCSLLSFLCFPQNRIIFSEENMSFSARFPEAKKIILEFLKWKKQFPIYVLRVKVRAKHKKLTRQVFKEKNQHTLANLLINCCLIFDYLCLGKGGTFCWVEIVIGMRICIWNTRRRKRWYVVATYCPCILHWMKFCGIVF